MHADLSEFNLILLDDEIYIIDVSQSVEQDHVMALEFLRKDCTNVNEYFRKREVATLSVRELFDFITDPNITGDNIDDCLDRLKKLSLEKGDPEGAGETRRKSARPGGSRPCVPSATGTSARRTRGNVRGRLRKRPS